MVTYVLVIFILFKLWWFRINRPGYLIPKLSHYSLWYTVLSNDLWGGLYEKCPYAEILHVYASFFFFFSFCFPKHASRENEWPYFYFHDLLQLFTQLTCVYLLLVSVVKLKHLMESSSNWYNINQREDSLDKLWNLTIFLCLS